VDVPSGGSVEPSGNGEHDAEVGFDRVALGSEDRPRSYVGLRHAEAILDLPQLAVGRHHELRGRCLQVIDVPLQPGHDTAFIAGHGSRCGCARELDQPVPFDRCLPGNRFLRLGDLLSIPRRVRRASSARYR
jgi:hypothetical protein